MSTSSRRQVTIAEPRSQFPWTLSFATGAVGGIVVTIIYLIVIPLVNQLIPLLTS